MSDQILNNFKRDKQSKLNNEIDKQTKFKFQGIFKESSAKSGASLLKQIQCKNKALKQHNNSNLRKVKLAKQQQNPNYLTFCQKYAGILLQKYNNKGKIFSQFIDCDKKSHTKKQKKISNSSFKVNRDQTNTIQNNPLLSQKQVQKRLIYIKIYFDNNCTQLHLKVDNLKQKYSPKICTLMQKAERTQHQLQILDLFMSKMMKKVSKQYVTPFTLFLQQVQKTIKTPQKNKVKRKLELPDKLSSIKKQGKQNNLNSNIKLSHNYQNKPQQSQPKQPKMHISHIVTPKSPNLLSGYPSSHSRENSHLLVSFKKNTQQSENGFETLKYSQSDFSNSKRDQQSINKRHFQLQNQQQAEQNQNDQIFQLPFSPVQPYRIQTILKDIKQNRVIDQHSSKHKKETVDQIQIDIENLQPNNQLIDQQIGYYIKNAQKKFLSIADQTNTIQSQVSEAIDSFGRVLEKVEYSFQCQKMQSNEQWNQILQLLGQDLSNIQVELGKEKQNGQIRNQNILKKLQEIQNNLIEDLFAEKQQRKQQQEILAKTLNQLVANLEGIL